jgi:hypothetical protein
MRRRQQSLLTYEHLCHQDRHIASPFVEVGGCRRKTHRNGSGLGDPDIGYTYIRTDYLEV